MSVTTASKAANNNSAQTFVTSLVTNAVLLTVEVSAFVILKQKLGRIYSPRTYLPPPDKRAKELPGGPWRWLPAVVMSPAEDIIQKNGLDAYMFLRFLKMLIFIFTVFTFFTFAVLLPVDAANIQGDQSGLNRFTWTNVASTNAQSRFAAHIILVYLLTFFVLYMIRCEMLHFVHMRQQFLISKSHSRLAQARTVLITQVPDELANEHDMRLFASFVPGGVDRVWFFRDTKDLNKLFEKRQKACSKLEAAESKLLKKATKSWHVKQIAQKKAKKMKPKDEEKQESEEDLIVPATPTHEFLDELVPRDARPKHRTGFLGLFGTKVDTIDHCKDEIARLNPLIQEAREHIVKGKFLGSAFVRCNLQMGAHVLAQCVSYHQPLTMYDKWLEAHPKDIVWANLDDGAVESRSRYLLSWLATVGLIIAWVFPVAFIGTLSNLSSLCQKVSWLAWVCTAPTPVPGIIQGVLPPLLLAILFALIPIVLRALAWYEDIPRYSLISVSLYRRFFLFLLIHGFLIVTLTSGITAAIEDIIKNPASTIQTLAQQLPGASIFFLTYTVSQGLAGAGSALIQLVPLILHFIRKWFLGRTPRQAFGVTFQMPSADFGIVMPGISLLATIALAYSVISPIINLLALVSFSCIYLAWKFLLLQVFDQPDQSETGGLYFPMAVGNLFVGLYIEHICLASLFFLKISVARASSIAEAVLMLVLLVITGLFHIVMHKSFHPITNYLPMSLATKKMAKRYERERQRRAGLAEQIEDDIDLFSRDRLRSVRRRIQALPQKIHDDIATMTTSGNKRNPDSIDKDRKKDDIHAEASGTSTRPDGAPDLFRHLSVPEEDKHDQYNRRANSSGSVPRSDNGVPRISRHPSTDSRASKASKTSNVSKASKTSKASERRVENSNTQANKADIPDHDDDGDDSSGDEADFDEHAFDHPSTYEEQAWIWVPKDTLGLSKLLVGDLNSVGVVASDKGAAMDSRGVVEVTRNPPDEQWVGGNDE